MKRDKKMIENKDVSLFVVSHKKVKHILKEPGYKYISVGGHYRDDYNDNDGKDNISEKNPYYCELTATYWIWKNCDSNYVGLLHYRRLFGKRILGLFFKPAKIGKLKELATVNDAVLSKPYPFKKKTAKQHYIEARGSEELDATEEVIKVRFPKYLPYWNEVMNSHSIHACNIIFCKKEVFDRYCEFLFPLLNEVEKKLGNIDRVYGYISEWLLDVFVKGENLQYKEYNVVFMQTIPQRIRSKFKNLSIRVNKLLKR